MRAVIYKETWLKTDSLDKPVTYYVLALLYNQSKSSHSTRGCVEVRSLKKSHLIEEIVKIQKQGDLRIVPGKLPSDLSSIENTVLGSDPVKITRKPYDLSSLIGK